MSSFSRFAAIAVAAFLLSAGPSRAQDAIPGVPRELLEDIATGSRILADLGVVDAFGHVSARHPTNPHHFLMARSIAPAQVTANDIMEFDENGEPVDARNRAVFLERFIHAEVYKARPDINAVVHTHSPGVVPFSVSHTPLKPLYHNAAFLGTGAPVWDIGKEFGATNMLVSNNVIGKSLAATLGDKSVVLMRGHGDVAVGPSVKAAVFRAYYTDVNAKLQAQAIGLGSDVTYLSAEEAAKADAVNMVIMDRAWALWKQKAQSAK
ncbi:class II aldolase/adducin family protein [Bradyrhizobium sp. HKCCYLRH1065]|uniref:class II aldolase/adducin family protein n=1 Tax=unclassified Bradyrhizobium TaxID=2631580 RepID=UPI003EB85AB9